MKMNHLLGYTRLLFQIKRNDVMTKIKRNLTEIKPFVKRRQTAASPQVLKAMEEFRNEREFKDINVETFNELITNDKIREKVELILSEYEYEKYTTLRVPSTLTMEDMKFLLETRDLLERKSVIGYLYEKEMGKFRHKLVRKEYGEKYRAEQQQKWAQLGGNKRSGIFNENGEIAYGLWHNTLVTKIYPKAINKFSAHRLCVAAKFGQQIVIDLDFDQYMNAVECRRLAKQIHQSYYYNRYKATEPFDLHFANCKKDMPTYKAIPNHFQNLDPAYLVSNFHTKSYLDLFPNERLVYLTPNAKDPIRFNHDDIYIIGGFIDKSCKDPASFLKAKREGLRVARLPIDEYIVWGSGSKYLCLNHVLSILHDYKISGNWRKSLSDNIPQRKQKQIEEIAYEDELRLQKYRRQLKMGNQERKSSVKEF